MSSQLLASKIVIVEEEPRVRNIAGVPTAVVGCVGVTERGPVGVPTLVTSFEEFLNVFGGYNANGDAAQALDGFFTNAGGSGQVWFVRTVHYTDITNPSTKTSAAATIDLLSASAAPTAGSVLASNAGTYDLEPGQTLVVNRDALGNATATFTATAAARECANAETYNITDGMNLTVEIDGGAVQTAVFDASEITVGAATAAQVAAVLAAELTGCSVSVTSGGTKVTITSDRRGTTSGVNVTGGTANAVLGFVTGNTAGTGNVGNIDAVTVAEVETVVEAAVSGVSVINDAGRVRITSNTTGASSLVQVVNTSTATAFGFDNASHSGTTGTPTNTLRVDAKYDGAYGNNLKVVVEAATSGDADEFNLKVMLNGLVVEVWPNLSMTDTDMNYVETVVNAANTGSKLISVVDLDLAVASPGDRPANVTSANFTGGSDGLSSLDDNDFIGSSGGSGKTGIRALDIVQDLSLLIVPGRATSAVHNAMITYAETTRDKQVFTILDPPANQSATQIITYVDTTAAIGGSSEHAAIYWPRVKVLNPSKTVFGNVAQITVPPSGHIAGVFARTDSARDGGVYDPPAGVEKGQLLGVLDFETTEVLEEEKRDLVYPKRINPLTVLPGSPRHIDGTRTLKGNGNFPTIAERRGAIFIEQSVKNGLQFARHKNNDEELRATVSRTVTNFLLAQMKLRAFRTQDPATAFYVDFGDALNPVSVQFAGKLVGRIGIATQKPADFIELRFSQDTRALEEELAG